MCIGDEKESPAQSAFQQGLGSGCCLQAAIDLMFLGVFRSRIAGQKNRLQFDFRASTIVFQNQRLE